MERLPSKSLIKGALSIFLGLLPLAGSAQSLLEDYTPVTLEQLENPPETDWLMWRGTQNHWGHSPLDQINKENVGSLRLAWAWTMGPGLQETTPLVHDGVMFLPQACDFIEAVDATDGTLLWEYRRPESRPCCATVLRESQWHSL